MADKLDELPPYRLIQAQLRAQRGKFGIRSMDPKHQARRIPRDHPHDKKDHGQDAKHNR